MSRMGYFDAWGGYVVTRRMWAEEFTLSDIFILNSRLRQCDKDIRDSWARCRAKLVEEAHLNIELKQPIED